MHLSHTLAHVRDRFSPRARGSDSGFLICESAGLLSAFFFLLLLLLFVLFKKTFFTAHFGYGNSFLLLLLCFLFSFQPTRSNFDISCNLRLETRTAAEVTQFETGGGRRRSGRAKTGQRQEQRGKKERKEKKRGH